MAIATALICTCDGAKGLNIRFQYSLYISRTYVFAVLDFQHLQTSVLPVADKSSEIILKDELLSYTLIIIQTYLWRLDVAIAPTGESSHSNRNK